MKKITLVYVFLIAFISMFIPVAAQSQLITQPSESRAVSSLSHEQIWKIEKMTYSYAKVQGSNQVIAKSGTEESVGTFTVNGDTGGYSYVLDGAEKKGTFKLEDRSSEKALYSYYMSKEGSFIHNTYTVTKEESSNIEIVGEEITMDKDSRTVFSTVFYLSK
jgi:hypothetical protein